MGLSAINRKSNAFGHVIEILITAGQFGGISGGVVFVLQKTSATNLRTERFVGATVNGDQWSGGSSAPPGGRLRDFDVSASTPAQVQQSIDSWFADTSAQGPGLCNVVGGVVSCTDYVYCKVNSLDPFSIDIVRMGQPRLPGEDVF